MEYTIYDSTSGEINGTVITNDETHLKHSTYIEGNYNGDDYYVVDSTAVLRPLLTSVIDIDKTTFTADGTDVVSITSLLNSIVTIVKTDESNYPTFNELVSDGYLDISSLVEGIFNLVIESFPYKVYRVDLEAE